MIHDPIWYPVRSSFLKMKGSVDFFCWPVPPGTYHLRLPINTQLEIRSWEHFRCSRKQVQIRVFCQFPIREGFLVWNSISLSYASGYIEITFFSDFILLQSLKPQFYVILCRIMRFCLGYHFPSDFVLQLHRTSKTIFFPRCKHALNQ